MSDPRFLVLAADGVTVAVGTLDPETHAEFGGRYGVGYHLERSTELTEWFVVRLGHVEVR